MRGAGGTPGGLWLFGLGFLLCIVTLYLFFDSVIVETAPHGLIGRALRGRGGAFLTTSMGVLFIPFFIGVLGLFYDATMKWAWWLTGIGIAILIVEISSRFYFRVEMKLTHLLLMLTLFAAGAAMMLRSYRSLAPANEPADGAPEEKPQEPSEP